MGRIPPDGCVFQTNLPDGALFLIWIRAALPGRCALFLKICREKGREPERARRPATRRRRAGGSLSFWGGGGGSLPRPWPPGGGRAACGRPTLSIAQRRKNRGTPPKKQRSGGCPKRKTAAGKRSDRGAVPLLLAYPFFPALSRGRRIFNRRFDHWISPASARESSGSGAHGNCIARGGASSGGTVRGFCPATVFAARFRLHFAKPAVRKGRGKERRREAIEREEEERERKRGAEKRPRFHSFTLRVRGAVENFFGGIKAVENCFPGGGRTGFIRCPD